MITRPTQIQKKLLAALCDFEGLPSGHLISTSSPCSFSMFIHCVIFFSQSAVFTVSEPITQVAPKKPALAVFDVFARYAQFYHLATWLALVLERRCSLCAD
jgi:hypothetical protein